MFEILFVCFHVFLNWMHIVSRLHNISAISNLLFVECQGMNCNAFAVVAVPHHHWGSPPQQEAALPVFRFEQDSSACKVLLVVIFPPLWTVFSGKSRSHCYSIGFLWQHTQDTSSSTVKLHSPRWQSLA